ncbi:MAG: tRNA (guanosine(37)-N1)-methyltransferase TrmD [Deltaproteobacteria bacterium]|nr:tRNA (guanosine(37)-N1)-methyltransferase TrmD [Deltaproteobacteria bacterium]
MIFDVLTLFPAIFDSFLTQSLLAKALTKGIITVNLINIRDFTSDRHRTADDRPYGGGPGMVLKPEPLGLALESVLAQAPPQRLVINLTPSGRQLDQDLVRELSARPRLILLCGRYEGIDQRVLDVYSNLELSIGDYVLNGGEVPAMVLIEALSRLIAGFLGDEESLLDESYSSGLLEYPHYTRPRVWRNLAVPEILVSGNHAQVAAFRLAEAVAKTRARRPDLLASPDLEKRQAEIFSRPGSPLKPRPDQTQSSPEPTAQSSGHDDRSNQPSPPGQPGQAGQADQPD